MYIYLVFFLVNALYPMWIYSHSLPFLLYLFHYTIEMVFFILLCDVLVVAVAISRIMFVLH